MPQQGVLLDGRQARRQSAIRNPRSAICKRPRWLVLIGGFLLLLAGLSCGVVAPPMLPLPPQLPVPDIWYGVSTSAYQIEDPAVGPGQDGFFQTDWDVLAERGELAIPKGNAEWSYTESARDVQALAWLGVTHYRFGIEWARVEPQPGQYHQAAVQHYVDFAKALRDAGIEPIVCLWHFTFPSWLADWDEPGRYGWLNPIAAERWAAYVELMATRLAPYAALWAPQNEPDIQTQAAFMVSAFPPSVWFRTDLMEQNLEATVAAFNDAAAIIRRVYPGQAGPDRPPVRIMCIQALSWWMQDPLLDPIGTALRSVQETGIRHSERVRDTIDIFGFTYYGLDWVSPFAALLRPLRTGSAYADTGLTLYPEGLTLLIGQMAERFGKPMVILENGIADASDEKRPEYLLRHIDAVRQAIDDGHPVLGYFHWSLMDNYEWRDGYGPKFGLFAVNAATRELEAKEAAEWYREVISRRGGTMEVPAG